MTVLLIPEPSPSPCSLQFVSSADMKQSGTLGTMPNCSNEIYTFSLESKSLGVWALWREMS